MDLMARLESPDLRVNEVKKAQIKRPLSLLRLRALLLLSSLLSLRKLLRLLLRRRRRLLRLLLKRLAIHLVRRALQVAKGTKETLERMAQTARRETPVLVVALVRRDARALLDRVDLLVRPEHLRM
jgi:hypothetical protein